MAPMMKATSFMGRYQLENFSNIFFLLSILS